MEAGKTTAKALKKPRRIPESPTVEQLLAVMEPGTRYTIKQLATQLGIALPDAERLTAIALQAGGARRAQTKGGPVFWIPSARELAVDQRHMDRCSFMNGTLTGYDSSIKRYRELCMLTRG